jgi:capsular exopolysaccharide synthesis family protein
VPAEESVGVGEVLGALWRRKGAVVCISLIGTLAGLVPGLLKAPVYRARTSMQLEGFNENYLNLRDVTPVSPVVANASAEAYLQNQLKILESETLAKRVAAKIWPGNVPEPPANPTSLTRLLAPLRLGSRAPLSTEERQVVKLRKALAVRSSLQSQILEILYDSTDPVLAAKVANAAAAEYIAMNREARFQSVQDTTEWLTQETANLKGKLEKSGQELQDYARSSGLLFTTDQGTLAQERMRQLQDSLSRAENERASKQSRYQAAMQGSQDSIPEILDNQQMRDYQSALMGLQRQLAELSAVYGPSHYKVKQLAAEISNLTGMMDKTRQNIMDRIQSEFKASENMEGLLSQAYGQQKREVEQQTERQARYEMLRREVATTQQLYDSMLQKVKEAGVASALRATNIRVLDPATPPREPYSPRTSLNCAIGLGLGILLGVGVAVTQEQTDHSVRRPGETRQLNLREIGVIPSAAEDPTLNPNRLNLLRHPSVPLELVTWHHGPSLLAESFRGTLASILFSSGNNPPPRVLALTSVDSMEGKTTVLSNLGIALAETDRRVVLVDADLRRPRLHGVFDVCNDRGLTDILSSGQQLTADVLDGLVSHTGIPNLDLIPSGPGAARVTNLLYSKRLGEMLEQLRRKYDIVLVDTPPMSAFSDARVLGRWSDGVILVVRSGKTSRLKIHASAQQFAEDHTPIHGAILNDWRGNTGMGRYGYSSRRYEGTV